MTQTTRTTWRSGKAATPTASPRATSRSRHPTPPRSPSHRRRHCRFRRRRRRRKLRVDKVRARDERTRMLFRLRCKLFRNDNYPFAGENSYPSSSSCYSFRIVYYTHTKWWRFEKLCEVFSNLSFIIAIAPLSAFWNQFKSNAKWANLDRYKHS